MSFAYLALEPADEEYNTPCSWPDGWTFPSTSAGPWPPGWPVSAENLAGEDDADYSIALTLDAWLYAGGTATVTVRTLLNGADTDDFDCQLIKVEADIGGTVVQVKKNADDSFANQIYFRVENYSGSNYGFSESVILDLDSGDDASTVTITATLCSTDPEYTDEGDLSASNPIIYVTGAFGSSSDADVYADQVGTWLAVSNSPVTNQKQFGGASVSGVAYYYGGKSSNVFTQENYSFTLADLSYDRKTPMPTPARVIAASCAIGINAYIFGGYDGSTTEYLDNDQFAPATDVWTSKLDMTSTARSSLNACEISSKGYCFGGASSGPTVLYDLTDEYNAGTNAWASKATLAAVIANVGASTVGSYGYVYGGNDAVGTSQTTHQRYDPAGNSFSSMTALASPARNSMAAAAAHSLAFAIGGIDGESDNDSYNPSTNTWAAQTSRDVSTYQVKALAA